MEWWTGMLNLGDVPAGLLWSVDYAPNFLYHTHN
jgi:hypothetical protein